MGRGESEGQGIGERGVSGGKDCARNARVNYFLLKTVKMNCASATCSFLPKQIHWQGTARCAIIAP